MLKIAFSRTDDTEKAIHKYSKEKLVQNVS